KAKEAVGAIAKLTHTDGREITVNVEYNQLGPLLTSSGFSPEGDVNGPDGLSPFPGNINELVFELSSYAKVLDRTGGMMEEFINPKYKDSSRTTFSPTRLECMMQDYPKVLGPEASVGFSAYPIEFGYFPVKNSIEAGAKLSAAGVPAGTASTAEAAVYHAACTMLRRLGAEIGPPTRQTFHGVSVSVGPMVVLHPTFAMCFIQLKERVRQPAKIEITSKSTLFLKGDVVIDELKLDGSLWIEAAPGAQRGVRLRPLGGAAPSAACG
ncbi:hypothetical protein CYMTET_16663, partial [Cymbomonas tetramitiformis]